MATSKKASKKAEDPYAAYKEMDDEQLEEANAELSLQKEEIRNEQLAINRIMTSRAADIRVIDVIEAMTPEEMERAVEIIAENQPAIAQRIGVKGIDARRR